jgi:hypothetical protein
VLRKQCQRWIYMVKFYVISISCFPHSFRQRINFLSPCVQVYTEGAKWTVKQVLVHFITIERSMHWLFKNILSGGSGSPDDFDVDRFNLTQTKKLDGRILEELIEQLKSTLQQAAGNLPPLRNFGLIFDSLANPAASYGECARFFGPNQFVKTPLPS